MAQRGGYYPSIMQGILRTGPYFTTIAVSQGIRLIRNNSKRMANRTRKLKRKGRKQSRASRR